MPLPQLSGKSLYPTPYPFSNKNPYYPHKSLFLSVFSSKRRKEFSVSHCGIQKPQCGIHISHCEIQIPHCGTENMQRDFKKYLPELQLTLPTNQSDEVSGAYSCKVNSPRSTPKAFMANAPISSSPGITTIGASPSSHSRNPWVQ